jgi:hypothetical protein
MLTGEGYCLCGCGQKTGIATKTRNPIGHVKGEHKPYINGHNRRKIDRYREEDRGYETPCHIWLLAKSKWGYGLEAVGHSGRAAHLVAYEKRYGPVAKGLDLDHLCRQRDCINSDHLEPVIRAVNIQRGDLAKLVPEDIPVIRQLLSEGYMQKEIAPLYGVTPGAIGAIARGHTWRNV